MRLRTVLLVLATIAVVLFALLNWDEFRRPSVLNLGWQSVTAPLGLVMLGLLALGLVAVIISSASTHTRHLMETRQHHKDLQAQRELAERAEASRFVDLRTQLDTHLRETRQRDVAAAAELEQAVGKSQRELRNHIEQMHRSISMRLGEMEARLEARLSRTESPTRVAGLRADETLRDEPLRPASEPPMREATHDEALRDASVRKGFGRHDPLKNEAAARETARTEPALGDPAGPAPSDRVR
jgi:hypothetical protein